MTGESSLRYPGWRVAAASAVALSFAAYLPYAFPVLLKLVSDEFSWSREQMSTAFGISSLMMALCSAPVGYIVDRAGSTRVVPVFLALFGATFGSLFFLTSDIRHFYVVFALLGVFVTGILPIGFARTVSSWFDERRGLALALAISGGSIGGFLQPPAVHLLADRYGWRTTCLLMGMFAVLVGVPVARLFIEERTAGQSVSANTIEGISVREGLRTRVFWTITLVFFCSTLLQYGAVVHLSALLTDRGVTAARAAAALSVFGAASLIGRLIAGSLLDRFFAARVACLLLGTAGVGAMILTEAASFTTGAIAAFLIGVGTAGESDVVPYLLTKYFGLRSCSTLYGIAWIAVSLGAAGGPILMGRSFDATSSYTTVLMMYAFAIFAAAALMLTMPRYDQVRSMWARLAPSARTCVFALFLLSSAAPALAQVTSATMTGTIADATGAVLPGAEVTLTNEATGAQRSAITDASGRFAIAGLTPASYSVRAALQGFRPHLQTGVVLTVGQQASIVITLDIGPASDAVEVVGGTTFVDLRTSALSGVVPEADIEALPLNGRNYISLALLQPGVSIFLDRPATNNSGGIELHINGATARSNSYLLDGANMRSFYGVGITTAAETTLGVETVREFRVVTNSFSSDYGRAMGGVINVVTKSGSNEVRGSAFEFHRNSGMDARNFFDPVSGPPPFNRNQYGFSLGGPIQRDRMFFFGGGEWLRERLSVNKVLNVPDMSARTGGLGPIAPAIAPYLALYPQANGPSLGPGVARYTYVAKQPTDETFLQGRVDYNMSERDQLFVRYTDDRANRLAPLTFEQFTNESESTNGLFTVEARRIFGTRGLNTARISHSRLLFGNTVPPTGVPQSLWLMQPWNAPNGALNDFGNIVVGGLSELGATATNPLILNTRYLTISDDVSISMGRHALKFGFLMERVSNYVMVSTFARGNYTFPNVTSFLAGRASLFNTVFPGSELDRERRHMLYGFYIQDDITRGRVTLNAGLRYEFYTVPKDIRDRDSALRNIATDTSFTVGPQYENPSKKNFGPRIGIAWDVEGHGRTSVRAGTGVFYDTDNTFNSAQIIGVFSPPFAAFAALPSPVFPATSFAASPVAPRFVDYNIKQPRLWSYNANVQRQFGPGLNAMIAYAGSRGYNLVRAVEGNPNRPTVQPDGSTFFPASGLVRLNPAWGAMDLRTSGGRSWYNSLQAVMQKRFRQGAQLQSSYTVAKVEDLTQGQLGFDTSNSPIFAQDPFNPDRAPSDFDIRHTFTFNVTWPLSFAATRTGVAGALLAGWHVTGVGNFHSGTPFTPTIVANWSRSGSNRTADRPNVVAGCSNLYLHDVRHYINPACFSLPPAGTFGNAGRNSLRGPAYGSVDLSVVKTHAFRAGRGARSLQFRVEAFNLLNRANFAVPSGQIFAGVSDTEAPLASAGQITRTISSARQMQLGIKFVF